LNPVRWHEWINRSLTPRMQHVHHYTWEAARHHTHDTAVTQILDTRPRGQRESFSGCVYWGNTQNRALLLYALLSRPGTVSEFAKHVGLPDVSKLYVFLREWGIAFKCFMPAPRVQARGNERIVEGRLSFHNDTYTLHAQGRTYTVRYTEWGEWVIDNDPGPDLTLSHAFHAVQYHQDAPQSYTCARDLPQDVLVRELNVLSMHYTGHGIKPHPSIRGERIIPERTLVYVFGKEAVRKAMSATNRCRCQFWDDRSMTCGLLARRQAPCEDFVPLEAPTHDYDHHPTR
jgi:hypothetical protein